MVPTPRHSVPDVLHLVHSGTGSVLQLATIASSPHLCLQFPDPRAIAVDALSILRDMQCVYAYPPAALMQRVLHKFVHLDECHILLVALLQHTSCGC